MQNKNLVIAIYTHPDAYPPTINATQILSNEFSRIAILFQPVLEVGIQYPDNVDLIASGKPLYIRDFERKSAFFKAMRFLQFTMKMYLTIRRVKPSLLLFYDPIPLLSYRIISYVLSAKMKVWYHNHDILELAKTKKYTIARAAALNEKKMFNKLDFFSLPSKGREKYYPLDNFRGKYFFIPNLPAKSFYSKFYNHKKASHSLVKLIFQGTISKGHGLENIITYILTSEIREKKFELNLKGFIKDDYKKDLSLLAKQYDVEDRVIFHEFSAYQEVPKIASQCHIGIGVHDGSEVLHKTLATSSNKIYEYAAVGLPVLLYDDKHFKETLGKYEWTFFTDLSEKSLTQSIEMILENYEYLSRKAKKDFIDHLNFETFFRPALNKVFEEIK